MATSGTVSLTTFETQKVIDHAFRRCRVLPQQVTSEHIDTAMELLHLYLTSAANDGIPLWCIDRNILPIYRGEKSVLLPVGTVDVMNFNIRQLTRLTGTNTATQGTADDAFDGDTDTANTQTAGGGNIQVQFTSATQVDNYGILPNATGTWDISIEGSQDGSSWTVLYTNSTFAAVDGEWFWLDLERQIPYEYIRLNSVTPTVLDVREFYVANNGTEIPMPKINRDDYSNLPDKTFLSRPTEYWFDKTAVGASGQSVATVWPVPDTEFTFFQYVTYLKRYIQDVGTMIQEIEVPPRWYMSIVCELARHLGREIKEVDEQLLPRLDTDALTETRRAWAGEADGSPVKLRPKMDVYTR